jgi:(2Fe-2S) ferredoxin
MSRMGKCHHNQISDFNYEGVFLGFTTLDGYKLNYIRLTTAEGNLIIKIPKEQRLEFYRSLKTGDLIQCTGKQKLNLATGESKFKAYSILKTVTKTVPQVQESAEVIHLSDRSSQRQQVKPSTKPLVNVLVCQKSDCVKRGSSEVCNALLGALEEQDLAGYVKVKSTGCLKHCKSGPHLVVMPDKSRYSKVKVGDVPDIVEAIRNQVSDRIMPEAG